MSRLNSGIKNRYNFFIHTIFLFPIIGTDSVNHAKSWDIKSLIQFPGNSILKILRQFWRLYAWAFNSQNHPERSTFYVRFHV